MSLFTKLYECYELFFSATIIVCLLLLLIFIVTPEVIKIMKCKDYFVRPVAKDTNLDQWHVSIRDFFASPDIHPGVNYVRLKNAKHLYVGSLNCPLTATAPRFRICLYPIENDNVSNYIYMHGSWETYITDFLQQAMIEYPDSLFLDVGANIGFFSLLAAAMGHDVIAIEPVNETVSKLQKSVEVNGLQQKILVVENAVSDSRRLVSLARDPVCQGCRHVQETSSGTLVETILLDDILPLTKSSVTILKIDVG